MLVQCWFQLSFINTIHVTNENYRINSTYRKRQFLCISWRVEFFWDMAIPSDCCSVLAGMQSQDSWTMCLWTTYSTYWEWTNCHCWKWQKSLNTLPSLKFAQPFLSCRLYCWTALYVSAVCGIVYSQFLLLFYLNSVLKQLLVLVLYTKIVWVLLSDF